MNAMPTVEVRLENNAVGVNGGTVGVVVRVVAPRSDVKGKRPHLNLAFVLDRSAAITEEALERIKSALGQVAAASRPGDRFALVAFGDEATTVVPSTDYINVSWLENALSDVRGNGAAALHPGWVAGGLEVARHLDPAAVNQVVLVGASPVGVGESDPAVISTDVAGLAARGIATSTLGFGKQAADELLYAMARAGRGRYWHAEEPSDTVPAVLGEHADLSSTVGRNVVLRLHAGVAFAGVDVLNDFPQDREDVLLPDLVAGRSVEVGGTVRVPALEQGEHLLGAVDLLFTDVRDGREHRIRREIGVRVVEDAGVANEDVDHMAAASLALLRVARMKRQAFDAARSGDEGAVARAISGARRMLKRVQRAARVEEELADLDVLEEAYEAADIELLMMRLHAQAVGARRSFDVSVSGAEAPMATSALRRWLVPSAERDVTLELTVGDITDEALEAIVNPSNQVLMGAGATVDGAVHRRGGPSLTQACREIGHCDIGQAVFTPGYGLPAQYVIHTATPKWKGGLPADRRLLASCYTASLAMARRIGVRHLAFPLIGAGTNGYPLDVACEVAAEAVMGYLRENQGFDTVRFVAFTDDIAEVLGEYVSEAVLREEGTSIPLRGEQHA